MCLVGSPFDSDVFGRHVLEINPGSGCSKGYFNIRGKDHIEDERYNLIFSETRDSVHNGNLITARLNRIPPYQGVIQDGHYHLFSVNPVEWDDNCPIEKEDVFH